MTVVIAFPKGPTAFAFIGCYEDMRYIVNYTKYYATCNNNLSSFNRIKRSSLVGLDDAVETFERHADYEEGGTETDHP